MSAITKERLTEFAGNPHSNIVSAFLVNNADEILMENGITTALILSHFMGQIYVETGALTAMEENLHYSASRLHQVFPRYFPTLESAESYAGDPEKIANKVYGGRMGNKTAGDGYKYRGSGLLQLTGKTNATLMTKKTGIDLVNHPELSRDPANALRVAASIWRALGCNAPASRDDCVTVSRLINGGDNGLDERCYAVEKASEIFIDYPKQDNYQPLGLMSVSSISNISPMTTTQAKLLQKKLKDKNYSPGEIDGKIGGAKTVGAIATLQSQQGLPVTGVVDDDTEDAIQNAPPMEVSENRKNETADSLRAKGSQTIASADSSINGSHGVTVTGASLLGTGSIAIISQLNDQADQLKRLTDHVPGLGEKIELFIILYWPWLLVMAIGVLLVYLARRIYAASHVIITERVRKSSSGEDLSH